MPKTKATASADETDVLIEGARTTRIREGGVQHTALIYKGDKPKIGQVIRFILENGVTYEATVKDFTDAGGEILAEFSDGPRPVATK